MRYLFLLLFLSGCFLTDVPDLTNPYNLEGNGPWYYRTHPQCEVYLDESIKTEMLRYGPTYKPAQYDPHYHSWLDCIQREFDSKKLDGGI